MNINRSLLTLCIIGLVSSGLGLMLVLSRLQRSEVTSDKELVLGTMSGWPPYVSINQQGDYEGFDVDISREIARRLDKQLTIRDMDTAALITALDQGKVDFIMTGLSITAERQQKIAMIPYQGKPITSYPLVFWKQIPVGLQTIEDLARTNTATVCVEAGSSQDSFLKQYEDRITIKRIAPSLAILDSMYGKSIAVLLEEGLLGEFKKKYPDLVALEIPLDEQNVVLGNGIGVNKTNTALIQNIERIIQELKTEGFLAATEQRWFGVSS